MFLTENEIFSQYTALEQTLQYFLQNAQRIRDFTQMEDYSSVTYIGCGSGYCLCQSAALSARMRLKKPAYAIAAGDMMLHFSDYRSSLSGTLLIAPSRSGSTSEVLRAVDTAAEALNIPCIAISAVEGAPLTDRAVLGLEIPWAFDESVCQTRTVTNLYAANLLLIAILSNDNELIAEIQTAIALGPAYMERYKTVLKEIADAPWDKVVVLADSELAGIGDEAAVAFKEIPQVPSNYYHFLDVRHGPMVLLDEKTLVIAACTPSGAEYQRQLIGDIKDKGACVISVGSGEGAYGADYHMDHPNYVNYGVAGIPFIFAAQGISYYKALKKGINPDVPPGLSPWIKL